MKRFNYILLSAGLLFAGSCHNDDNSNNTGTSTCTIEADCSMPDGIITRQQADEMEELYKANQYQYINNEIAPYMDNREVVFSLKELKSYIRYVESLVPAEEVEDLGLRVYLGAKNVDEGGVMVPKTTVFFSPTTTGDLEDDNGEKGSTARFDPDNQVNIEEASILNYGTSGSVPVEFR